MSCRPLAGVQSSDWLSLAKRMRSKLEVRPSARWNLAALMPSAFLCALRTMAKRERNAAIITLRKKSQSASDLALQFNLCRGRVRQIAVSHGPLERRRSQLKSMFRTLGKLPDDTPVDVLIPCEANIQHWEARVRQLHRASTAIRTLGDLRSTASPGLLREPHIGARLVAELRSHCPFRSGRKKLGHDRRLGMSPVAERFCTRNGCRGSPDWSSSRVARPSRLRQLDPSNGARLIRRRRWLPSPGPGGGFG